MSESVPEEVQQKANELVDAGQALANQAYDAGQVGAGVALSALFSTIKRLTGIAEDLSKNITQ